MTAIRKNMHGFDFFYFSLTNVHSLYYYHNLLM